MPALSAIEVRLLKETAQRFAEDSLRPYIARRAQLMAPPAKVIAAYSELGLALVGLAKDMGGLALGPLATALVTESLAAGDINMAFALPQPGAFGEALVRLGSPTQRARWGRDFALNPERTWGALAIVTDGSLTASRQGDGSLQLQGELPRVWHACRADRLIVILDGPQDVAQATGHGEQVAVVLPLPHPGVTVGERLHTLGLPMAAAAPVTLHAVPIATDAILRQGDLSAELELMYANVDLRMASLALGAARAASAYVLSFAEARRQAGKPLAHFQSMGFLLVDMHLACETALKRLREAASAAQASALSLHGIPAAERVDLSDLISGIAAARAEAEEVAFFVTDSAVQILDDGKEVMDGHPIAAWHHDVQHLAQAHRRPAQPETSKT